MPKDEIVYKRVTTIKEFIDAVRIRVDVFILEQGCPPGWEPDEIDKVCEHFIAVADTGAIVATARLYDCSDGVFKIERMVVKKEFRGKGVGQGLTRHIISEAKKRNPSLLWLEAQSRAQKFFEKSGFQKVSDEYDLFDLKIPHIKMEYMLH